MAISDEMRARGGGLRRRRLLPIAASLAGLIVLAGCGAPSGDDAAPPPSSSSSAPAPPSSVAPALAVPAGQRLVLTATVERGSQVYTCTHGTWSAGVPAAVLTAPETDVLHTAGPRWTATADASAVTATPVASVPVPGAVPELLLRASAHEGTGVLSTVDLVQRLSTHGGQGPVGACPEGRQQAVGYTAEYRFYAPDL